MPSFDAIQDEIAAMLDVADDDLTDEQRQAMDAYLDELAQAEADKVDAFAGFIRQEAARVKFLKDEAALDALPDIYKVSTVKVEPDKTTIGAALKDGKALPGCRLVNAISLQIR